MEKPLWMVCSYDEGIRLVTHDYSKALKFYKEEVEWVQEESDSYGRNHDIDERLYLARVESCHTFNKEGKFTETKFEIKP